MEDRKQGTELKDLSPSAAKEQKTPQVSSFKIRWLMLAVVTFFLMAVGYNRACFGVVDNTYSRFFRVNTMNVDWLTHSMSAVSVVCCLTTLLLLPFYDCGFRLYCLTAAVCVSIAYACHLLSALSRSLFLVAVLGQVSMGVVNALAITLVPVVGALWFPKDEIATAVGISLGGIDVGNMLGFTVPAYFLNNNEDLQEPEWTEFVRRHLILVFLACFTLAFVVLIVTAVWVKDAPPIPPSLSEAAKRRLSLRDSLKVDSVTSRVFYYFKLIFHDRTFLTLVVCFGIVETCYMLEVLMMADILRANRDLEAGAQDESSIRASRILCVYAAGGLFGGVVSGVVLDRTKRFKLVAVGAGFSMAAFAGGFLGSIVMRNAPGAFATNAFYGFFNGACYTALYEIIAQHMYPINELALGAWITFFVSFAGLVVPLLGRLVFNAVASVGVLALQTAVLFLATVLILCLRPRYERYSVNSTESDTPSVTTPLVKN